MELLLVQPALREVNAIISGRGFTLGTLKGHTFGATIQGLLWKQDLNSRLKIP